MKRLRAFGRFWWNFVVGDDWRAAAGIVVAIALTASLVAAGLDAWWLLPAAVAAILGLSLRREAGARPRRVSPTPTSRGARRRTSPHTSR